MKALILCDGEPPSRELLQAYLPQADLVICTDGASRWAAKAGCTPHVIIGDMDSCRKPGECEIVDCGAHDQQENTDSEKALLLALERGADEITLLGATGRRLDHTLGNVWLVARYHDRAEIALVDDHGKLMVVSEQLVVDAEAGQLVSLLALTPDVVVDTYGLEWPLHGPLEVGTRGLSNEAIDDEVIIEVRAGLVAVIIPSVR